MDKRIVALAAAAGAVVGAGAGVTSAPETAIRSTLVDARSVSLAELKGSSDTAIVAAINQISDLTAYTEGNSQPQR